MKAFLNVSVFFYYLHQILLILGGLCGSFYQSHGECILCDDTIYKETPCNSNRRIKSVKKEACFWADHNDFGTCEIQS